jgi:hypothetical protein
MQSRQATEAGQLRRPQGPWRRASAVHRSHRHSGASAVWGRTHARLSVYWEPMSGGQPADGDVRRGAVVRAWTIGLAVAVTAVVVVALLQSGVGDGEGARMTGVSVTVDATHPRRAVPARFLGLSFELSALRQLAQYADSGDVVALLRSLGPGVLRFGGVSADTRTAWTDRATPRPGWASGTVEAGDLRRLGRLAARSDWHVLLTIGLGHYDPRAAAREAKAAKAALGPWLLGIELGNEPDAYAQHGLRSASWSFSRYSGEVVAYRHAIARAAPGIALAGPDVSGSRVFESWGPGEARRLHPALLTGHHYPLGCHEVPAPTVPRLLSPSIRRLESLSLKRYLSVSRASAIPFRMDETNSVSCGGRTGISDTFASALWALDYIARAMAAGVAGMNFHGNPANCRGYSPLCAETPERLASGALSAQPEWYALLLARALIGGQPVRSVVRYSERANIDLTTFLAPDGALRVVIVDDDPPGSRAALVSVHVGRGFAAGRMLSLTAPSPAAHTGVELGGRPADDGGSWHEPRSLPQAANRGGVISVAISPTSAALLTVPVRAGAAH